jgi:hypothetical protein
LATDAAIVLEDGDETPQSLQAVLLVQLRTLFEEERTDFLPTDKIIEHLNADKELPFAEFRNGKGITAEKLKSMLSRYGVKPDRQTTGKRERGYKLCDLQPIFDRYLSPKS